MIGELEERLSALDEYIMALQNAQEAIKGTDTQAAAEAKALGGLIEGAEAEMRELDQRLIKLYREEYAHGD